MDKLSFNIFPNVNFIDLCMYQFGHEQCEPGHSFGPATRNHYLFHYVLSGTGTLMADNAKGITQTYNIKSGQGFLIFPGQINTYIAETSFLGNTYGLSLTVCASRRLSPQQSLPKIILYITHTQRISAKSLLRKCSTSQGIPQNHRIT